METRTNNETQPTTFLEKSATAMALTITLAAGPNAIAEISHGLDEENAAKTATAAATTYNPELSPEEHKRLHDTKMQEAADHIDRAKDHQEDAAVNLGFVGAAWVLRGAVKSRPSKKS